MHSFTILLALASIAQGSVIAKRTVPAKAGWTLTFSDDFVGTAGSLPSQDKWIIDTGTQYPGGEPGWGNNEVQTYTKNKENLEIITGNYLKMTPRKAANGAWSSSRIETKRNDFVAREGGMMYIEGRIYLGTAPASKQQGIWPAFWALGGAFRGNYHNWPQVTEYDLLEVINGQTKLYSTVHCGVAPGGPCNEFTGITSGGSNTFTRGKFHILGLQIDRSMVGGGKKGTWKDEVMTWYLDGKVIYTIKGSRVNDAAAWGQLAHRGHFLVLNVAVGGNWAGAPNAQTIGGPDVGMQVDYVAVWNK